jgi:hypothetical protein
VSVDDDHFMYQVISHRNGKKHKDNLDLKKPKQPRIDDAIQSANKFADQSDQFNMRLVSKFISTGIPLNALMSPLLKQFLQTEIKIILPSVSTLRQATVPKIYDIKLDELRDFIGENDIYLVMDETTDACNRYVLKIVAGIFDGKSFKTYLLHTVFLQRTKNQFIV